MKFTSNKKGAYSLEILAFVLSVIMVGLIIWQIILQYSVEKSQNISSEQTNRQLNEISNTMNKLVPEKPIIEIWGFEMDHNVEPSYVDSSCSYSVCKPEDYWWDYSASRTNYSTFLFNIRNSGKRANNLEIDFYCQNITIVRIINPKNCEMSIESDYGVDNHVKFSKLDNIDSCYFEIAYEAKEDNLFTCYFSYASDETQGKTEVSLKN